ncbi:MAG: hypothetical protein ACNA78_03790 [Balneolaceae bacterium]
MAKEKLTISEKRILRELIFPEQFNHIVTETGFTYGTVRDDLIKLINHRFVDVMEEESVSQSTGFYDSDHIEDYQFKATKTGLKQIR